MKKILITTLVLGFCFVGFSQEVEKVDKKPERIKVVKGGESVPVDATKDVNSKITPQKELANCKNTLEAIDKKEAHIRSNPTELALANENGWFTDAEKARATLNKRIKELKLELKNN